MVDVGTIETIKLGSKQLKEAVKPTGIKVKGEGEGYKKEWVITQEEIINMVRNNEALTPRDVKAFIDSSEEEMAALQLIPEAVEFSIEEGADGLTQRRQQLSESLEQFGIKEVKVERENYTADEVWDAVYYETRKANGEDVDDLPFLGDTRGARIKRNSKVITDQLEEEQRQIIYAFNDGLKAEGIDPLSLTTERLQGLAGETFNLHIKQRVADKTKVIVRDALVIRKKLQRWEVVDKFLNQRAEGRVGQAGDIEPLDSRLVWGVSWQEGDKQMKIDGVPYESAKPGQLTVVEILGVLEETDRMFRTLMEQLQGGVQGRNGWVAEAMLRRLNEVWTETSNIYQREGKPQKNWVSELGHTFTVADWFEIPGVKAILTEPDLYQQRDPLTDKPLEIDPLPVIERRLKEKARNLQVPEAKVDAAIMISSMMQFGYWIGDIGWKIRHMAYKYQLEDIGAGLPMWGLLENDLREMPREERLGFEAEIAALNAYLVGSTADYFSYHIGRIPDEAATEDFIYIAQVREAPVYKVPRDEVIKVLSRAQKIPENELRDMLEESCLRREQYRWQFVWAKYGGLYKDFNHRIGAESGENKYLNPTSKEDRQVLVDFLQKADSPATAILAEAGIDSSWITDEVIERLFDIDNLKVVKEYREMIYNTRGTKVELSRLKPDAQRAGGLPEGDAARTEVLAMILEFVLRDKRTWGVDMGKNNSYLASPEFTKSIRAKGGFGANEINMIRVMEYLRGYLYYSYKKTLAVTTRLRIPEWESPQEAVYGLLTGWNESMKQDWTNHLILPVQTGWGINMIRLMTGYILEGYEAELGTFTKSQTNLYDEMDTQQILKPYRYFPIVGSAQRARDRAGHLVWRERRRLLQRAEVSTALDKRWEILFAVSPDISQIIPHLIVGEKGKGMYMHCVRKIDPVSGGDGEVVLNTDPDYWLVRNEREGRYLYLPGSRMALRQWVQQAGHGQMDKDKAKEQIDGFVAGGFMRHWINDKFEVVGLGDLFKVEFENSKGQMQIFPIDFMVDMRSRVESVAAQFAAAKGYAYPGMFWQNAKTDNLDPAGKRLWEEFRGEMLKGWLVDPELADSEMPKVYWQWRRMALVMLGLTEESLEGMPESGVLEKGYEAVRKLRDITMERVNKILRRYEEGRDDVLTPKVKRDLRKKMKREPIMNALGEIQGAYGEWLLREIGEELERAEEKGLFLGEKIKIRELIENHYRKGKIDKEIRNRLLTRVIETRYRPDFLKRDWKDPNFWINNKWFTIWGGVIDAAVGFVGKLTEDRIGLSKQLWWQKAMLAVNSSPGGYAIAAVSQIGPIWKILQVARLQGWQFTISLESLFGFLSKIPFVPTEIVVPITGAMALEIFVALQGAAILASNGLRIINWLTRKVRKGRGIADSDALVHIEEKIRGGG